MKKGGIEFDLTEDGDLEMYGDFDLCCALADEKYPDFSGNIYINDKLVN